jgi:hypothetical protein
MDRLSKYINFLNGQTEGIVGDYNRINHPEIYLKLKEELDNIKKIDDESLFNPQFLKEEWF